MLYNYKSFLNGKVRMLPYSIFKYIIIALFDAIFYTNVFFHSM